jgi:hypothetical protein
MCSGTRTHTTHTHTTNTHTPQTHTHHKQTHHTHTHTTHTHTHHKHTHTHHTRTHTHTTHTHTHHTHTYLSFRVKGRDTQRGNGKLSFHYYFDIRHNHDGTAVSYTRRLSFTPKEISWYSFLSESEWPRTTECRQKCSVT